MNNEITNTSNNPRPEWLLGGNPDAIEAQEAQGQEELINSDVLPTQCLGESRAILESKGVVFGDPVRGDDLFIHVTLPKGWKKEGTSHSMWSSLLDENGNEVASIFYKAAFYDRRAFLRISSRGA